MQAEPRRVTLLARLANRVDGWALAILACGVAASLHGALVHAEGYDEFWHMLCAMFYWEGRFDLMPQNPPFVKLCLTLPMHAIGLHVDTAWVLRGEGFTGAAARWVEAHGERINLGFTLARGVSVLFYAVGAVLVGSWSGRLFGPWARRLAMALWCFNPLVLSHAMMAMVDVGAAVMGLAAAQAFVSLLAKPAWLRMLRAATLLGLALCSKFTLLVLPGVCFCCALLHVMLPRRGWRWRLRTLGMAAAACGLALPVVSACYFFRGLGRPLADRTFYSNTFRSVQQWAASHDLGTALDYLVRSIPADYVAGLDGQWTHVEGGYPNYFHGRIALKGFWYYYPVALATRMPVALWGIALLAVYRAFRGAVGPRGDEECLLLAPLVLFLLCQMNPTVTFLRYVMPVVPFACVWAGRAAATVTATREAHCRVPGLLAGAAQSESGAMALASPLRRSYVLLVALVLATAGSPLVQHPHYLTYFNEAAGGVRKAWPYFGPSEIDVGQDAKRLREWQRRHPNARPMQVVLYSPFSPLYLGLVDDSSTFSGGGALVRPVPCVAVCIEPQIGYLAISVGMLNYLSASRIDLDWPPAANHDFCRWLRERPPLEVVGKSIFIYYLTESDIAAFHGWQKNERIDGTAHES